MTSPTVVDRAASVAEPTALPRQRTRQDRQMLRLLMSAEHPIVHSFPHGAVFVFDHDLRYLSAGGLGLREVGLSREMLEGKTIHEAFDAETAAVIEPLYRAALAGESTVYDVAYAGRIFSQRLSPVLGQHGVLAAMGFTQDVTDARLSEQQLRESEQRFRLAFDHAPIGKAIVGLDGLFREVNPALCRLTGYPASRLLGLTFQDITHPDDLEADLTQLAQLVAGEIDGYAMEKRYYRADGLLVWVLLTVSLVLADDGEPLYFVSQIQDITDRKEHEHLLAHAHATSAAALEHAATHDELTGLPNRRLIGQRLATLLEVPSRRAPDSTTAAILFCDLDGFKIVNDTFGHEVGDAVLREAARRLTAAARMSDTIGRLGGDEFVVVLQAPDQDDLLPLAERVAARICSSMAMPFEVADQTLSVTASLGIALTEPGIDADTLLRNADSAMYRAKRGGKSNFTIYQSASAHRPTETQRGEDPTPPAAERAERPAPQSALNARRPRHLDEAEQRRPATAQRLTATQGLVTDSRRDLQVQTHDH